MSIPLSELRDDNELDEGECVGEPPGEAATELEVEERFEESRVAVRWMAMVGGRAVEVAMVKIVMYGRGRRM